MKKFIKENLISLSDFIAKFYNPDRKFVLEMAQIGKNVKLDNGLYDMAVHGTNAGDRPYPHMHIYKTRGNKTFDFEISLVDLLCDDELNLISMKDKSSNINRRNRNICSWEGYRIFKKDFEDWLEDDVKRPGGDEFENNIDYAIWAYDDESGGDEETFSPFLDYIRKQGKKIHSEYHNLKTFEKIKQFYSDLF